MAHGQDDPPAFVPRSITMVSLQAFATTLASSTLLSCVVHGARRNAPQIECLRHSETCANSGYPPNCTVIGRLVPGVQALQESLQENLHCRCDDRHC
jgi:hypothetical protein